MLRSFVAEKKPSVGDKIVIGIVVFVVVVVFVAYIIQVNSHCEIIRRDIANAGYVTYVGEFRHDDYQKDSYYHNVYITDHSGNQVKLQLPDYGNIYDTHENYQEIPVGSCTGTIVYGVNSKIIIKWSAEKVLE